MLARQPLPLGVDTHFTLLLFYWFGETSLAIFGKLRHHVLVILFLIVWAAQLSVQAW